MWSSTSAASSQNGQHNSCMRWGNTGSNLSSQNGQHILPCVGAMLEPTVQDEEEQTNTFRPALRFGTLERRVSGAIWPGIR
eukprot:360190-Chlamydomonas_euryale.AAC.3